MAPFDWLDSNKNQHTMKLSYYWSNHDHACVSLDDEAPDLKISLTPPANSSGWNNTDVQCSIVATDGSWMSELRDSVSGAVVVPTRTIRPANNVTVTTLSDSLPITNEGTSLVVANAIDLAGLTATKTLPVLIDKTPPTISGPSPLPAANQYGWNRTPVSRTFTCSDDLSHIATCTSPVVVATEGKNEPLVGRAIDLAGNEQDATIYVNIDETPPTIAYSGNLGTYDVDAVVNIACAASDALSGVRTNGCRNLNGPAYSFNIGSNSFTASASDYADNTAQQTVTFTVVVTFIGMENLTKQFVTRPGIANSMIAPLDNASRSAATGNSAAKNGQINAFTNEVSAQSGRALSSTDAATLIRLAQYL